MTDVKYDDINETENLNPESRLITDHLTEP